jgi:hypothetical protein
VGAGGAALRSRELCFLFHDKKLVYPWTERDRECEYDGLVHLLGERDEKVDK